MKIAFNSFLKVYNAGGLLYIYIYLEGRVAGDTEAVADLGVAGREREWFGGGGKGMWRR